MDTDGQGRHGRTARRGKRHGRRAGRGASLTRRGRILLWSAGVLALLILGAAGTGAWVYRQLDGNIHAADVDGKIGGDRPENLSPGSKNILVVGSDSRDGDNAAYGKGLTTMQSDTLMVMHLAADRKWATVVSLPRDSWVRIPACDRGDGNTSDPHRFKINESFAIGGTGGDVAGAAACTIKTVEQSTGLRIDHFASVDFQGFKGMVNALEGIEVCPEAPIDDPKAHLDLEAGCQTVQGEDALGYVRTRYSVGDGSDLGRIGRQQEFMEALAAKARKTLTSPADLYGFLDSATRSITTDRALAGVKPLASLASEVQDIPSDRLTFVTVPNYAREADVPTDKANVVWQYPQAGDLFRSLAADREIDGKALKKAAANPLYARSVQVRVLNGTGVSGRAAQVAEELRALGFTVVGTGNAPRQAERTAVLHPPGMENHARVLTSRLHGAKADQDARSADQALTLIVGQDYDGVT
ncbi:LCP family protein [Streptomyces durocortorensis]|uniref:LCP family protein n=1 Tax=Streptomyces durocortorensis TaxID=2811104 RepID=UPI003FD7D56F